MDQDGKYKIFKDFLQEYNISQVKLSQELSEFTEKFTDRFQTKKYESDQATTLFMGLKSPSQDIIKIVNHKGLAFILADAESFALLKVFMVKMINQSNPTTLNRNANQSRQQLVNKPHQIKPEQVVFVLATKTMQENFRNLKEKNSAIRQKIRTVDVNIEDFSINSFLSQQLNNKFVDKKFVFVIPSYNNQDYYKKNLDSVINQTYKNWRIIYIDDASRDNTNTLVREYIKQNNISEKVTIVTNEKNMKQAYCRFHAFQKIDNEDIICFLDGDDWLFDNNVLYSLNQEYNSDIVMTFGSYYEYRNNQLSNKLMISNLPNNAIIDEKYRNTQSWDGIPLRTGYAYLYKSIPERYYKDANKEWMSACTDVAEFLWAIEQSSGKFKNITYPTYVYNIDASKRFDNSIFNLSDQQKKYRIATKDKIYSYNNPLLQQQSFASFLEKYNVTQVKTSSALAHFHNRIKKQYNLSDHNLSDYSLSDYSLSDSNKQAIFYGLYFPEDLQNYLNHKGLKVIVSGGSDFNFISENIKTKKIDVNNTIFIAISEDLYNRFKTLKTQNKTHINVFCKSDFSLVDKSIFYPRYESLAKQSGKKIYIYDGYSKTQTAHNSVTYGKKYYDEVIKQLSLKPEDIIFSSSLGGIPNEKMPEIYEQCYIGLRLTENDGNANTVQEFEAMNIPIVHNQSKYGLKWKTTDDIINNIKKIKNNINFLVNLDNKCLVISECLKHFTGQYNNSHKPLEYNSNLDCVFFGMYNEKDCMNLINHKGKKYILWGGTDLRFVDSIKKYYSHIFHKNITHLAISKFIFNKLVNFTNNVIYLNFDLIDNTNISSFHENIKKELIYIYTAPDERRAKMTYGYDLYNPLTKYFTGEKFLIANNQSYKYSEMKKVYSNIKLGIRTTYFDGNANTVQELSTNGIYSLNNSDIIGSIPYIEDTEILKHHVSYLLKNLTIPDKKLYISSQTQKQNKCCVYNYSRRYNIYILYTDKPFLTDSIGGAAINEINKISALIYSNNVYYNNIYINDCFDENNNFLAEKFSGKYKNEFKINNNRIDFCIDKWNSKPLFYPSRDYDFVFYRAPGHIEIYEKIFNLLHEPKIWSHSYNKNIWSKNIIGFQTETASILADMKYLQNYDTDGTINYQKNMIVPKRNNFIMYQSVREKTKIIRNLGIKSKYNTKFIIGIIGTIYKYTYPWSHLKIIDKLRNKYPKLNIQLIILSHTICEEIHKKGHIHFINSPKHMLPSYLNEIDIILDTWNNEQIIFGGSNKLIDCIHNEVPVITANTFAHKELLGKGYKLFHKFQATEKYFSNSIENDIQNKIEYCMDSNNYNTIKKYLTEIKRKYNSEIVSQKYSIQFNKFYNKNILIICPDLNVGGVVTYTLNMINSLKKFNLYLCIENKNNISEIYYNSIKSFIKELTYDKLVNTDLHFDTVICNSSPVKFNDKSDNIMSKLNTITGNLIYITHNDVAEANSFLKKYNHLLDKIITVNNLTITKLSKNFNINESKFNCIPPCSNFIPDAQPKSKINKIMGYFGRVNDIKQPKFLIKCFDKIIEQFPDWKLYIVGPSIKPWNIIDIKKNIRNSKNKELLERNVVIVDKNIECEEEKRRYYKLFDILVSTTTIEGFPFVVSESLRMGTPVIITNVGGNKDCIKSGYNGDILNFKGLYTDQIYDDNIYIKLINQMYANEQYNLNEFSKVVVQYLKSPEKILEMSKNALETIKYKYNNIQFKNKLFEII